MSASRPPLIVSLCAGSGEEGEPKRLLEGVLSTDESGKLRVLAAAGG